MKILFLSALIFSVHLFAATKGCQEYGGTYYCVQTEDNGIPAENKIFELKDGVLTMKANPYEVKPQKFSLDGKTYVTKDGQGDVINTVGACSGADTVVMQTIPKMTYQREYQIHYVNNKNILFSDITTTQNTNSYVYNWNCILK